MSGLLLSQRHFFLRASRSFWNARRSALQSTGNILKNDIIVMSLLLLKKIRKIVCGYLLTYPRIYIYIYIYIYLYNMYVCVGGVCVCVYVYVCVGVCVRARVYVYVYVYVCVCVCVHNDSNQSYEGSGGTGFGIVAFSKRVAGDIRHKW